MPALAELQRLLAGKPDGPIREAAEIESAVARCWQEFAGAERGGMKSEKISDRMERVEWHHPELSFVIERHGGTVKGSTRAELQFWTVNLLTKTAVLGRAGHRQMKPKAKPILVDPIAQEIAASIRAGVEDSRLRWHGQEEVEVLAAKIFETGSAYQQTVAGRRQKLVRKIGELLGGEGWRLLPRHKLTRSRA